ncbi:MAG: hypothetical protein Kow0042_28940 [Calditrichia bacterium]
MPEKKGGKTPPSKKTPPKENKAKAAFEDYKRRMDEHYAAATRGKEMGTPAGPPGFATGMPPWGAPPPFPGGMPPPFAPPPGAEPTGQVKDAASTAGSLLERIGNVLSLGVDLLNVGLSGGLKLMEGFSGMERYPSYGHLHGMEYGHGYCPECYPGGMHHHQECGCEPCCCGECHPGVWNC